MARSDLIPLNKRTKEEQKKITKKGGEKSGEVRRERKRLGELMRLLLSQDLTPELRQKVEAAFPHLPKGASIGEALNVSLLLEAFEGNVQAYNAIRDIVGEKPTEKTESRNDTTFNITWQYGGSDAPLPSDESEVDT